MFCKTKGVGESWSGAGLDPAYGLILDGYKNMNGGSTSSIPPSSDGSRSYCDRGYTCTAGIMTECPAGKFCEDYSL
jgi:hypothetical protein